MPNLTNKELQLILQEGEGYKIEFKENTSGSGINNVILESLANIEVMRNGE